MGISTQHTTLYRSDDNGVSFTKINEVTTVSLPDGSVPELDASTLSSASKEYIAGLSDEGSVNFAVNFQGADPTHQQLMADKAAGTNLLWRIDVPEPGGTKTTATFNGYVSTFGGEFAVDQVQNLSGSIRVNGAVTHAHGVA